MKYIDLNIFCDCEILIVLIDFAGDKPTKKLEKHRRTPRNPSINRIQQGNKMDIKWENYSRNFLFN